MVGFINYLFLIYSDCHEEPHHEEPHHEQPHHEEPHHEQPHHEQPHQEEPHREEAHHEEPHHEEPHHEEPYREEPHHEEPHHEEITSIRASNVVTPKDHPRPNSASIPTSSQTWYTFFEMPVIRHGYSRILAMQSYEKKYVNDA